MWQDFFVGACIVVIASGPAPAVAQVGSAKPSVSVPVQRQLYRYVDNVGTKILGCTEDIVHNGTTFTNLATASDVVKFKTCIETVIDVPRKELKAIQGNCAGEPPIWGVTASEALEAWFVAVSADGRIAKFSLKDKEGKETPFTLPSDVLVGFKPKSDTKVLFTKPPTAWDVDFAKVTKGFDDMDSQKIAKTIKEGGFSVYSASK